MLRNACPDVFGKASPRAIRLVETFPFSYMGNSFVNWFRDFVLRMFRGDPSFRQDDKEDFVRR